MGNNSFLMGLFLVEQRIYPQIDKLYNSIDILKLSLKAQLGRNALRNCSNFSLTVVLASRSIFFPSNTKRVLDEAFSKLGPFHYFGFREF